MSLALNLRFPTPNTVVIKFDEAESDRLDFTTPLTAENLADIRWYLEVYAAQYTADVDDQRADRVTAQLKTWGAALFDAVFSSRAAQRLFNDFQDCEEPGRLVTISASQPEILGLPWELLRDPAGTFLLHENPRISVRRRLAGAGGGRRAYRFQPQDTVRLLFVISRPSDAGFIDPRSEAQAVLKAVETEAAGQVAVEFLRPATLDALVERLENPHLPRVDILHFDGHGVYDKDGRHWEAAKLSDRTLTKDSRQDAADMGYLLFEDEEGKQALISAETLGEMLHRQKIGLVVLSACQSATVKQTTPKDGEEQDSPGVLGSVAARLTHGGIPAVLAMTHSVLVTTTRMLFEQFYQGLARGQGMGEALDNARRKLYRDRKRGTRLRGQHEVIELKLQDWFLPALYQAGADTPLLTGAAPTTTEPETPWGNLPECQEAGFWGRSRELWQIERAFSQPQPRETRRLTISGFGGQGKTYLALEAGRWLHRTGLFERVCFVDYSGYQGQDPVSYAVSVLSTVLAQSFVDADAVGQHLRTAGAVLLILDNLEALAAEPQRALLTAAKVWSEVGQTRVLLTTRQPEFGYPDYPIEESLRHQRLQLAGLGSEKYPEDALAYFQALMKLPPEPKVPQPQRGPLVKFFAMVEFHPLSIGLLARQLKERRIAELGQRLGQLLQVGAERNPLVASLLLSLDRVDEAVRRWLPRLGVFEGGAFEDDLQAILEISEADWLPIRAQLEAAGLIQAEYLPNTKPPYLKFHPTLAPALWPQLTTEEQADLQTRHRQRYYQLSIYLYNEDQKNPLFARAIVRRELPNLMQAVNRAIAVRDPGAVDFVSSVNRFLDYFGLSKDRASLTQKLTQIQGEVGSKTWFLARSNEGEALRKAGQIAAALGVFRSVLQGLGEEPSYERCFTLGSIGRCLAAQGQTAQAATFQEQEISELDGLEQTDSVKREKGSAYADLGDVLMAMGDFEGARSAYEISLELKQEVGDDRGKAVTNGQLGTVAMLQGNLQEAADRYQNALQTFRQLGEPAMEATAWHQLGTVYYKAKDWDAADRHYRESAKLDEAQGNQAGAATTWNQLAMVSEGAGKIEAAKAWYEKAISGAKVSGDRLQESSSLNNLANLLQSQPHPSPDDLTTARQHAEAALEIDQTLDPAAAEIWKNYGLLAAIAEKQGRASAARTYRQQARQAKAAYAGTQYELRRFASLIVGVVMAVGGDAEAQEQLLPVLDELASQVPKLIHAFRQILDGERDEATIVDPLGPGESMIIHAILQGIADPATLAGLLGEA